MKPNLFVLLAALLLGLTWAIRGHFGHEWGAAWSGAVGAMAIVVGSKRKDWISQIPYLSALSALGWGVGGIMSYGIVIGYCRGDDFGNVMYGYTMLAVIGGLYGCIGGGFLGLGLESSENRQPKWSALITEMVAGGMLIWGILIHQFEWYMTPPRSELWAACLGGAAAMIWYMVRNGFTRALRVSLYTAAGAGFGFSFGNFIQGCGYAAGINYNWWNVMEFTLGFCGGAGLAYSVATTRWEETKSPPSLAQNLSLVFVIFFIPFINYLAAFNPEKISSLAEQLNINNVNSFMTGQHAQAWIALLSLGGLACWAWRQRNKVFAGQRFAVIILFTSALCYTLFGMIHKGFFYMPLSPSNSVATYIPILILSYFVYQKIRTPLYNVREEWQQKDFWIIALFMLFALVLFSIISININTPNAHTQYRF